QAAKIRGSTLDSSTARASERAFPSPVASSKSSLPSSTMLLLTSKNRSIFAERMRERWSRCAGVQMTQRHFLPPTRSKNEPQDRLPSRTRTPSVLGSDRVEKQG